MATYDKNSKPGICEEVALFATPLSNITCKQVNNVTYYPLTSVAGSSRVIEFTLKSSDQYIDLASTVLNMRVKCVVKEVKEGEAAVVPKKIFFENNLLSTMFERVDVLLSDKELTHTNDYYLYSYLYVLLNSSGTDQTNALQKAGFLMTSPGAQESITSDVALAGRQTATNQILNLSGPIYVPLALNRKWIVPGLTITLRFYLSDDSLWTLQSVEKPKYGLELMDCRLSVKQFVVNDLIRLTHEQQVLNTNFVYTLPNYQLTRRAMASGQKAFVFENLPTVYSKLFVVFVLEKALAGALPHSPFNFKSLKVKKISLQTGSLIRSYDQLNCEDMNFDDAYAELQRCLGNEHVPYSMKRMQHEPVFAFSVSPTNDNVMLPPRSEHSVRVIVELSEALTSGHTAVFFSYKPLILEVDAKRNFVAR
jgi:hypothetical protein